MNRRTAQFIVAWGLVVILFLGFLDIKFRDSTQRSDFVTAFYVAGHLVRDKQQSDLYPPQGARSFKNAPFVVRARTLLPFMLPGYTVEFMYSPIVAWAFVPFSFCPPWAALLLWQVVSLFAVIGSGALVVRPIASTGKLEHNPWLYGLAALTCLPVLHTLWQGQVGLVFGVLPLCAGYYLLMRNRPLQSGLVMSLSLLKPQFCVPAMMVAFGQTLNREFRCLTGLVFGVLAFFLVNITACGLDLCVGWLRCLRLRDSDFAVQTWAPPQFVTNLPNSLLFLLPPSLQPWSKPAIYAIALALMLGGLWHMARLRQSSLGREDKVSLCFLIAMLATPLIMPQLLVYDLSMLYPAGLIAGLYPWKAPVGEQFRKLTAVGWICVNVYWIVALTIRESLQPLTLTGIIMGLYWQVLAAVGNMSAGRRAE